MIKNVRTAKLNHGFKILPRSANRVIRRKVLPSKCGTETQWFLLSTLNIAGPETTLGAEFAGKI
jgi:hypothetical protein